MTSWHAAAPARAQPCASPASDADSELLRRCAEFKVMELHYQSAERALRESDGDDGGLLERCEAVLWPEYFGLLDAIAAMPATTPAGLRAKAGVLRMALAATTNATDDAGRAAGWEPHERLAWSLANDLAN